MADRVSDWYFSNGKDFDGVREQIAEARRHDRRVRFGLNGFVIVRDTEAEARETLREIIAKADRPAVEDFGARVIPIVRELQAQAQCRGELGRDELISTVS